MTERERKQFVEAWYEAENLITKMDPLFQPTVQLKRPENAGPEEIKLLLQFMRVMIISTLHAKESAERERDSFFNMLQQKQGASDG